MRLRTARERLNLTQEDLERRAGVSQNTISRLETSSHSRPAMATVKALARVLKVDPLRLEWGPDPRPKRNRRRRAPRSARVVVPPPPPLAVAPEVPAARAEGDV